MIARSALALGLCLALPLGAQATAPAPLHVVRGVVFDSVSRAPLVGAAVHIATRDSLGRPVTATTDSAGRFIVAGLPSGRYLIDFDHEVLGAFGLEAPLRSFTLATDALVTVDIGVPSGPVVRALRCGRDSAASLDGMLAGFVRDAEDAATFTGATITVAWRAIALDRGNFRTLEQRASATVAADGAYHLCGLPSEMPLDLRVTAPGHRSIVGYVSVPSASVARQDLRLTAAGAVVGSARLTARVMHENGSAVMSGRALIAALAREVSVDSGALLVTDLPQGTWVVEVRSIGLEPRSALIETAEGGGAARTITLGNQTQQLDAITIIGKPSPASKVLAELLIRQRTATGTVFLPDSPWLRDAQHVTQVLAAARGFTYRSPTEVYGRSDGRGQLCASVVVYLNGMFFPRGLEGLDEAVSVRDVLAVEAYPDIASAPLQWRMNRLLDESQSTVGRLARAESVACAVVAVWTRF